VPQIRALRRSIETLLGLFNKKKGKPGLLGISLIDKELALAHIGNAAGQPALLACELLPLGSAQDGGKVLAEKAQSLGLEQTRCNFVLAPDDYSLLLVEAPNVEPAELASAAKWKIKDMIDRPLEQLAISVFPVPRDAYRSSQRDMLYVVAADRKKVQTVVDMVIGAGLQLVSIDIPELAMRNLTTLYTDDSNGLAMMDLRHDGSLLNLSKNGAIYLTRHLSTQVGEDILRSHEWDTVKDRLVLEIQRSLDYYESQMGQGHINRVLVAPRKQDSDALKAELDQAMGVKVEVMNLQGKFTSNVELSFDLQQGCLMAIGGALRTEKAA
jgi:MSHA biogenesis protein MshI